MDNNINIAAANESEEWGILGKKTYELSNHLGNVLATVSDRKFGVPSGGSSLIDHYGNVAPGKEL